MYDPGAGVDLKALPDDEARAAYARERHVLARDAAAAVMPDDTGEPMSDDDLFALCRLYEYHRASATQWHMAASLFAGRGASRRHSAGLYVAEAIRWDIAAREETSPT
jgi:hypothetical protein